MGVVLGIGGGAVFAEYCWRYVDNSFAINPQTWECSYIPPSGAAAATPSTQMIIDEHANWHCINGWLGAAGGVGSGPDVGDPGYGLAFLAMHKQMINDFDLFRDSAALLNRIKTWDANDFPLGPNYNPMPWGIPGNPQLGFPGAGVSNATAGAIAGGVCLVGTGRSGDGVDPATYTPCPGCSVLPNQFRAPPIGTLDNFASADDLGNSLEVLWHGSFHNGISGAFDSNSNRCNDAGPPRTSPRDSMFWRAHKALDDVHSDWQQL